MPQQKGVDFLLRFGVYLSRLLQRMHECARAHITTRGDEKNTLFKRAKKGRKNLPNGAKNNDRKRRSKNDEFGERDVDETRRRGV